MQTPQQRARASAAEYAHPAIPTPVSDDQRQPHVTRLLDEYRTLHRDEIEWARQATAKINELPLPASAPGSNRMDRATAAGALTELRKTERVAKDQITRIRLQVETILDILAESAAELESAARERYDQITNTIAEQDQLPLEERNANGEQAVTKLRLPDTVRREVSSTIKQLHARPSKFLSV